MRKKKLTITLIVLLIAFPIVWYIKSRTTQKPTRKLPPVEIDFSAYTPSDDAPPSDNPAPGDPGIGGPLL